LRHFFLNLDDDLRPLEALFQELVFLAKLFKLGQEWIRLTWLGPSLNRLEALENPLSLWRRHVVRFDEYKLSLRRSLAKLRDWYNHPPVAGCEACIPGKRSAVWLSRAL
jgi:hypothetical protein